MRCQISHGGGLADNFSIASRRGPNEKAKKGDDLFTFEQERLINFSNFNASFAGVVVLQKSPACLLDF